MLSPKMQRTIRVNENQLIMLSERAHYDHSLAGYLHKRSADCSKWQLRWFVLYENLLFYYDSENCHRPSGVLLLEGCYCERLISTGNTSKSKDGHDKQYCFAISYRRENLRQYELRALNDSDCKNWIEAIREASFNKLLLQKEELEQKHLHLLQIVESEKTAKWQYTQQCEELASEIKKLRAELFALKKEWKPIHAYQSAGGANTTINQTTASGNGTATSAPRVEQETAELRKIKKVQSFFRGWLCRRRWKQIVEQYIKSPHAESMRKRNSLVFRMVEAEEEYMEQMEVLVSCFFRPFKMAASSKKPPCSHEDVNSIFLNSETVLFLHQIFLKGLTSRLENWPTLVLGDLFSMLLPMLSIYQEYVRNHHYSLQVLTECKQSSPFSQLLSRLENKTACHGRSLEQFLTYPMHQVPRYIITLHELLAHTPHDHVERKSLQNARQQLEDLSRQMHDEVSETENLRKNLSVERMIIEGCDILLDVNQVFVRQGCFSQRSLLQLATDTKSRGGRSKLHFKSEKESLRQCFLFSNHLIVATRSSSGKLHLVSDIGKIPLADALLIEDPNEMPTAEEEDVCSVSSHSSGISGASVAGGSNFHNRDFKLIVDIKSGIGTGSGTGIHGQCTVHLLASTIQDKAAWISDISQCMDNVQFNDMMRPIPGTISNNSSVSLPQSVKNDPKLFKDEQDIRFSRALNSCKVPQIRYATPERLLQRLTDLRFLSIDFLNTFLLTYRVFTDGATVLEALKKVFYNSDFETTPAADMINTCNTNVAGMFASPATNKEGGGSGSIITPTHLLLHADDEGDDDRLRSISPRRTSAASSVSGYGSEMSERDRSHSYDSQGHQRQRKSNLQKYDEEEYNRVSTVTTTTQHLLTGTLSPPPPPLACLPTIIRASFVRAGAGAGGQPETSTSVLNPISIRVEQQSSQDSNHSKYLSIPQVAASSSSETLTDINVHSAPCSPSNISSTTMVGGTSPSPSVIADNSIEEDDDDNDDNGGMFRSKAVDHGGNDREHSGCESKTIETATAEQVPMVEMYSVAVAASAAVEEQQSDEINLFYNTMHRASCTSSRSASISTTTTNAVLQNYYHYGSRRSIQESGDRNDGGKSTSARSSFQHDSPQKPSKAGVVITSFRQSKRRSSTSGAAAAFAIATSGSSNPRDLSPSSSQMRQRVPLLESAQDEFALERSRYKETVMSTAGTMRVLNVLRHWISKHAQDFQSERRLKTITIEFLDDIIYSPNLLPAEHKAAAQLLRLLTKEDPDSSSRVPDIHQLLTTTPITPSKDNIETLSALEIAEQLTYIDHQIFISICSEEFLGQAWMKTDKNSKAPHILLMTKRFNDVSRLVASEIIRRPTLSGRVSAIEKWTAVADISRCLHNFNGVLQICSAFTNSAVFRLKKTWERVSKTTKQTIEKLQVIVSSDGRFRSLRDALHRCDPPCIPYLGLYLTDLSFIEEGTPNFTPDGLLNFSKMRMIAHVIREIRHFQQTYYKIELILKVASYLLDSSLLLDDEELYNLSLEIEPRSSRLSNSGLAGTAVPNILLH